MEYIEKTIEIEKPNILKIIESNNKVHFQDWLIFRNTYAVKLHEKIITEYRNVYNYLCETYGKEICRDTIYCNKIHPEKKQYIFDFEELINFRKTEMGYFADKGEIIAKLIINIEFK